MTPGWIEPQSWPALAPGEVHVWLAHLPQMRGRLEELAQILSPDERERAARFQSSEPSERWQISRGLLRRLLERYLGRDARHLSFTYNDHGKPQVTDTAVEFNLSHSGDYVALAFTHAGAVGVDIERVREDLNRTEQIARRYFSPGEYEQFQSAAEAERARAFVELWTCKEAFVKARGDGLFSGLDQFEIRRSEARIATVRGVAATGWWMAALPPIAGYAGAVVVNAASCSARFWQWSEALIAGGLNETTVRSRH